MRWASRRSQARTRACSASSCRSSSATGCAARSSLESFEREDAFSDDGREPAEHRRVVDGGRTGECAAARGDAAPRPRVVGARRGGRDLSSSLDLATVMDRIARHAKDLLQAGNSAIFVPDPGTTTYRAIVAHGDVADAMKAMVIKGGVGIIGSIMQSGKPELVNDAEADPRGVQIPGTARQQDERLMVVPLVADDAVEGAMAVWRTGGQLFDERDLQFLVGPRAAGDGRAAQRAALQRNEGGARTANRDGRYPESHQQLAHRSPAGVRRHRAKCSRALRQPVRQRAALRRRMAAFRGEQRHGSGIPAADAQEISDASRCHAGSREGDSPQVGRHPGRCARRPGLRSATRRLPGAGGGCWAYRWCARARSSACSPSAGSSPDRFRKSTKNCSRPSPTRRSSRSRTCASSTRRRKRSSSRRPHPTYCR